MHLVITKVKLKPGSMEDCVKLFRQSNPDLVRDQPEWLGARMAVDRHNDTVTVIATWQDVAGYEALKKTEAFQETMGQFASLFASPPEITVSDVLVDMTPYSIAKD